MTQARPRSALRLLPAAALALTLLLALKLAGFGSEIAALLGPRTAQAEEHAAAEAPAEPAAEHGDAAADTASGEAGHGAPDAHKDAEAEDTDPGASGPTASEADVLESLATRREQLDARERDLDMREKVIAAAEKRVEERITELKAIEANIETMFGKRDEQEEAQLASLVKTYEAMKPGDAAQIFDTLEINVLLDVLSRIKPAKAAPILAAMKPERAQEVTVELARRYKLPEQAAAELPPAGPPAEAPPAEAPPEAPAEAPAETPAEAPAEAAPSPGATPGG
ncbi:MAG: hypothetical protein U1F24_13765 [Alphaproteobacteria bacterium]